MTGNFNIHNSLSNVIIEAMKNQSVMTQSSSSDKINVEQNTEPIIEKLKEYSIEQIHRLAENLILNTENNNNDINIYKDIFKFLKTIKEKYNTSLSLDLLSL